MQIFNNRSNLNYPTLYNPEFEHDGCGTGFIADLNGTPSHRVVQLGLEALARLTHRGAVSADASSGDGAGMTIQLPREVLAENAHDLGLPLGQLDRLAVAMVFLPAEEGHQQQGRVLLENAAYHSNCEVLGWRTVPTNPSILGGQARSTLPRIEQLLLARPLGISEIDFDRALYLGRRRAESAYRRSNIDAYIPSMSARTVVYKGLIVANKLKEFFLDLSDVRTVSNIGLFHQRFATNTLPNWNLAQPFRMIGHNGEVNTLVGNRNWMSAREPELTSPVWGDDVQDLIPVIWPIGSDSASFDEVFELLVMSGRDPLHAMKMLIPEAWENQPNMDPELRAFYQYHSCLTESWDGPAAIAFTDGAIVAAAMDRNGLRPARYQVAVDGLVLMGSEVGILDVPMEEIVESGRIGPGEIIAVDTVSGKFLLNEEIKRRLSRNKPYSEWVEKNIRRLNISNTQNTLSTLPNSELEQLQVLHGYTKEEIRTILKPMALEAKEGVGSMGDDTPPSVLNATRRSLYTYFRQRFAQVTNPAIDSIRERTVMSLEISLGSHGSILEEQPEAAQLLQLNSPVLSNEAMEAIRRPEKTGLNTTTIDATFPVTNGIGGFEQGIKSLRRASIDAVHAGNEILIISDRAVNEKQAPLPMLLAISVVHHHLIRMGLRQRTSIVAEAGDARDVHHLAALIGFGASAINPYLAIASVYQLVEDGEIDKKKALMSYTQAAEAGILKIMSKMGISTIESYHGAQIFEALGLSDEVINRFFPGTTSRIGGIDLTQIAVDSIECHQQAFSNQKMEVGGWYKFKRGGDHHANEPAVWRALHKVVDGGGKDAYEEYTEIVHSRPPTALRDLLTFSSDRRSVDIAKVESTESILSRFQTGAMSLGALSRETHEDIAKAMNQIGALANTGEGGEDPSRFLPQGAMRDANSSIKQVASARFGVTPAYLAAAKELEIKISQGSKPGEGGQLPGHKVSPYIAKLRYVLPGTPLISPAPHHDIYSIEDIAQLIYDLKTVNPTARVCVKLVAAEGVGTIAAGVAKAYADSIQISGADGGTGASPLSSVKYAGNPWELGLAETQQTLVLNNLRGRVRLIADGGLHTGRDVVMAALLGADRFGFGTAALIALGCKMARQCHVNTCPVGIATQAEELRKKYFGNPQMLITFLTHVAEEVRQILAELGYHSLKDLIGRAGLLKQIPAEKSDRWKGVDLTKMITAPRGKPLHWVRGSNDRPDTRLENKIIAAADDAIQRGTSFKASYEIQNSDRSVGGGLSAVIAKRHGDSGLNPGRIKLHFKGSAGQSFGAWLIDGVHMYLVGEANDYVAKGMHGGEIVIHPPAEVGFSAADATLVGNTVLYGATGGSLFVSGRAGERFAVRNSGATAVVEGIGDHGCEYMTSGLVLVLGQTGRNFGAGMSGGLAFVRDPDGSLPSRINKESVHLERLSDLEERGRVKDMVEIHHALTSSTLGDSILQDWENQIENFWRISPALT